MTQIRELQTNFTAGVLDPKLAVREDLTYYYSGLADGKNLIVEPAGGVTRRPGMRFLRKLAPTLNPLDTSGATVTAPHGGTAANLLDGDDTTSLVTDDTLGTTSPFVVAHVDLGSAQAITAVDVIDMLLSAGAIAGEFFIQYSADDITFTNYGAAFDLDAAARSRRRRGTDGASVTARYWRIARLGASSSSATVSVAGMAFWQEGTDLSNARLLPFAFSTRSAYMVAASDQNADIFSGPDYVCSTAIPHVSAQMQGLNFTQSLDTMLLFHRFRQPYKLFRQGGDTEFDFRTAEFTNIPQYDYGVLPSLSAGADEVQTITAHITSTSPSYRITLEGRKTSSISPSSTGATNAARIQAALRALSNTAPDGITVVNSGDDYTVTFSGGDGGRPWEQMTVTGITATVTRTTVGSRPGAGAGDEVQTLNVAGTASGDKFSLEFEGFKTTTITVGSTDADTAANIQTALRALENVGGDTGVTCTAGTDGFIVTFSGEKLGNQPHAAIQAFTLKGNGVWDVARTTIGKFPGEDIMSDARGWPRCGTFFKSRLHLGGIDGVPDAWLASCLNERFNFDETRDDNTKALVFRAEVEQVGAIYNIFPGRYLTFFTSDAEFYVPSESISDQSVLERATSTGSKVGLRVFDVDGAILFIQGVLDEATGQEIGTSLREFVFDELQQNFQANILSRLSASLINNPVDCAFKKALRSDQAGLYLTVNEDGTAVCFTRMRGDDVSAFMPLATRDGDTIASVGVDKRQQVYWITERSIGGARVRCVEMWDDSLKLDCGGNVTATAEEYAATPAQSVFTYTFDSPSEAAAIGVRLKGSRLAAPDYEVDLAGKTVTLSADVAAQVAAGDTLRIASMIKTVSGLDHLEGDTLQTYVDGSQGSGVTVSGGSFTLDDYADTEIQWGFDFEVSCALMPVRVPGAQTLMGKKVRVSEAFVELYQSGPVEFRANDGDWQEMQLVDYDDQDVLGKSTEELAFTGNKRLDGLAGYAVGGVFEIRQKGPGPFTLLAVTRKVSI